MRGDIDISANFALAVAKPLDGRTEAPTLADMYATDFAYIGLLCFCVEDGRTYRLESLPSTTAVNWQPIDQVNTIPAHTHEIAEINQLPEALDAKLAVTGGIITGDLSISGDLVVSGNTTTVNTTELDISDNIIEINSNQVGVPPATLQGGMRVNRGDEADYLLLFVESDDTFRIGIDGGLQAVATREDNPTDQGLSVWNDTENRFDTVWGTTGQLARWGANGVEFFTPSYLTALPPHGHSIADIANLQISLDNKANVTHGHSISDISGLTTALSTKADNSHTHAAADVLGGTAEGQVLTWRNGQAVWESPSGGGGLNGGPSGGGGTIDSTPPSAPNGLTVVGVNGSPNNGLGISWNPVSDADLSHYNLYRGSSANFDIALADVDYLNISGTSFTDIPLPSMATFHYRVTAVDTSGNESLPSNSAQGTVP